MKQTRKAGEKYRKARFNFENRRAKPEKSTGKRVFYYLITLKL